jgi:hypothetical protein
LEAAATASRKNNGSNAERAAASPSSAKKAASPNSDKRAATPIIQKGDRVRITNTVSKPRTWNNNFEWDQVKAQKATVTHFYRGQVHFVTDNGIQTWRAVNNLTREE